MNFLHNITLHSPPMLKRSTHAYCSLCFTNLEYYDQKRCEGCFLSLEEEGMVVYGSNERTEMGYTKRSWLRMKSRFHRVVRWMSPLSRCMESTMGKNRSDDDATIYRHQEEYQNQK